jgi:hypothetical protein
VLAIPQPDRSENPCVIRRPPPGFGFGLVRVIARELHDDRVVKIRGAAVTVLTGKNVIDALGEGRLLV